MSRRTSKRWRHDTAQGGDPAQLAAARLCDIFADLSDATLRKAKAIYTQRERMRDQ